jgi:hypothetical protein
MKTRLEKYHCIQCCDEWIAPAQDEEDWWIKLSKEKKGFIPELGVIDWLRKNSQFSEKEIKNIASHQVSEYGKCHNCNIFLSNYGFSECGNCGAVNYNYK